MGGFIFALIMLSFSSCGGSSQRQADLTTATTTAPTSSSGSTSQPTTQSTKQPTTESTTTSSSTRNNVSLGPNFGPGGPPPIAFGVVQVGSSRTLEITVGNGTDVTRTVRDISLEGDYPSEFEVMPASCAVGAQLPPQKECTLEVKFTPGSLDQRRVKLTISFSGNFPNSAWAFLVGGIGERPPIHTGPPIETQPTRTG
jgi:hypothetical protein